MLFSRYKQGEISIGTAQISQKYSEISPLFREYAPQEVKQSPMFADKTISKYGTTTSGSNSDTKEETPQKRMSSSTATFSFPSDKYKRRPIDTRQVSLLSVPSVGERILNTSRKSNAALYSDAQHEDIATEEFTACSSVRTRQSPQTRLETLGSNHTWILLLLPAITAILVILLHPYCIDTVELNDESCTSPFLCTTTALLQHDDGSTIPSSGVLRILLERSIASVNFIDVSMYIDHFKISSDVIDSVGRRMLSDTNRNETKNLYRVKTVLSSVDSADLGGIKIRNDKKNKEIDNSISLGKLSVKSESYIKETVLEYHYIDGSEDSTSLLEVKSLNNIGYLKGKSSYPIIDILLENVSDNFTNSVSTLSLQTKNANTKFVSKVHRRPMLEKDFNENDIKDAKKSKEIKKQKSNISPINKLQNSANNGNYLAAEDSNEDITIKNIRLVISTQSKIFSIWSSVLIIILSIISIITISISFSRIQAHVCYLLKKEKEKRNEKESKERKQNSFFYWLELILPEQFSGFGLIIALICWLNPISAVLMLLSVLDSNFSVPDILLFFSKLIESLGRQGKKLKI